MSCHVCNTYQLLLASMAFHPAALVLFFALSLSRIELSTSQFLRANVSCIDCAPNYDFSGIKVVVKCDNVKKLATTSTGSGGWFEVELPSSGVNCLAKIIGGTCQMYGSRKNMVSRIVKTKDSSAYTISTPLSFSISGGNGISMADSKTVDLPLPREWGLAPSSYYVPFLPIIGIP